MYTKKQATAVWDRLHDALANAEAALKEIIANQLWIPAGYETFTDAWIATQSDVMIAKELRPHVIYQLLAEGLTVDEVDDAVKGVGAHTIDQLNRQRKAGVPPENASVIVRNHQRTTRPHTLHLYIGAEQVEEYHRIVAGLGLPSTAVLSIALEAVEKRFRELASELR